MTNMEPEDFEAGENMTDQVQKSKPMGIVVSVRLTPEDSDKLVDLAEESGKTVSQLVRQAVRSFLSHRGQRPTFAPEITGSRPNVNIVTSASLGPRTEGVKVEELDRSLPPASRTGLLVETF